MALYKDAFKEGISKIILIWPQPEMLRQGVPEAREIWWFRIDWYKLFTLSWVKIEVMVWRDSRNLHMCCTLPVKLPTVKWKAATGIRVHMHQRRQMAACTLPRLTEGLAVTGTEPHTGNRLQKSLSFIWKLHCKWNKSLFGHSWDGGTEVLMMLNINTETGLTVKNK